MWMLFMQGGTGDESTMIEDSIDGEEQETLK